MRSLLLLLALAAPVFAARAQAVLSFETTAHEFGPIPEGTLATREFRFKNTGNQPLVIADAQASCGCTTPEWTRAPVLPGRGGLVKAVYNSAGRPGVFAKTITVSSNGGTVVLSLKGTVLTKEEQRAQLTPAQLAASPRLELERASYDGGRVELGQPVLFRVGIRNTGAQPLRLSTLTSNCFCVGYRAAPAPLAPGQRAVLELLYTPRLAGAAAELVTLASNDLHGDVRLTLRATVVKDLLQPSLVKESAAVVPFK